MKTLRKEKTHKIEMVSLSISPIDPKFQYQCYNCGRVSSDTSQIIKFPCR